MDLKLVELVALVRDRQECVFLLGLQCLHFHWGFCFPSSWVEPFGWSFVWLDLLVFCVCLFLCCFQVAWNNLLELVKFLLFLFDKICSPPLFECPLLEDMKAASCSLSLPIQHKLLPVLQNSFSCFKMVWKYFFLISHFNFIACLCPCEYGPALPVFYARVIRDYLNCRNEWDNFFLF